MGSRHMNHHTCVFREIQILEPSWDLPQKLCLKEHRVPLAPPKYTWQDRCRLGGRLFRTVHLPP